MVLFLLLEQFFGRLSFCKERRKGKSISNPVGICSYIPAQRCGDCESIVSEKGRRNHLKRRSFLLPFSDSSPHPPWLRRTLNCFWVANRPSNGTHQPLLCVISYPFNPVGANCVRPSNGTHPISPWSQTHRSGRSQIAPTGLIESIVYCAEVGMVRSD